ncbi:MAG: glycoside hydrolase family 15 protein, partial [Bacteroidota bacterium]
IIGDMHTAALVGMNGSIDWYCFPHFDSPSVFAALLDEKRGGRFAIFPQRDQVTNKQFYWPDTNLLVTRFLSPDGVAEIIDYMPVGEVTRRFGHHKLIRRVSCVRGTMPLRVVCAPAFNYARDSHETGIHTSGATFRSTSLALGFSSSVPLRHEGGAACADFTLSEGETASFVLQQAEGGEPPRELLPERELEEEFLKTVEYWRHWIAQCTYRGRWREMVQRSALVLKLLTFEPTGAIVAAPTCSLPEAVGGSRNWDYRYTWIRDAAFTLYALLRIGFTKEAEDFFRWLDRVAHDLNPGIPLQVMYGIDGRHTLTEETLDHLEGYRGSRPVRVGNGAYDQLQLDIYGELMDAAYLFNKYRTPISYDAWMVFRFLTNWVCDHWKEKDEGIWEVRGGRQNFVYSKVMCWVAVDRALRLADKRSFPAERDRWLKVRDEIYEDIMARGWNAEREAFVQSYGSDTLDAANLIMPLVFFLSPTDPRMLSTLAAINRPPNKGGLVSSSLVYRYNTQEYEDGLEGEEGTFNICTFWLVEALTRAGRNDRPRLEKARLIFEKMLGHANHLGLFAEETGHRGEALGNFPQAFTHLSLISSAFNLDRALGVRD